MINFIDVPTDHWAYEAIRDLSDKGIINGYEDGSFKPDEPITRAEVATIVARLKGF